MRLARKSDCLQCEYKCDIHTTLLNTGRKPADLRLMHCHFCRHDLICKQGTKVTHALFLVKGTAKLYIEGIHNRNIILYILKPPAYIGLLSFFETPEYSYSVAALDDCEVCLIELGLVRGLYIENHDLLLKLNKAFGRSVSAIMKKFISINQKQIRGRLAESLIYLSEINNGLKFNLGITRKEIGEMAAISEENTVRLLSEFAREGIISIDRREIEIIDFQMLEKISEVG